MLGVTTTAALWALAGCDDSSVDPPTSKKITFQLSAEVGGGEAGRSIAVRAYYLRNETQQVDLDVDPSTFAVAANTATEAVSVEVLPCLEDPNREAATDGQGDRCRVHLALRLRAANGTTVSEDEAVVTVTPAAVSLIVEPFALPSGALMPSVAVVDFDMVESGQLPAATTVSIASSSALQTGALSSTTQYLSGTGWLSVTVPSGESAVTLAPTATTLEPGQYEAIVRVTSAWMFTPAEIRVAYRVPPPPKVVTITGAGNGTGLVLVTPGGATCTTTAGELSGFCAVPRPHGSTVTLTPAPAVGSGFTGWSGACQGTEPCTLVMDQARAVTATFSLLKRDLTVDASGAGSGTVASTPPGIACTATGGQESGTCTTLFDHPTQVTLTATPTSETSTFTGWSGACQGTGACVVTMTEARAVTATFALIRRQLVVTMAGEGTGTVTSSAAGIDCPSSCSADFDHGTIVSLTATPGGTNMTFTGWSGDCTGTGTCTVTMDRARFVTATIVPPMHTLTVTATGNGQGSVRFSPLRPECSFFGSGSCTRDFPAGSVVQLVATLGNTLGNAYLSGCEPLVSPFQTASCRLLMNGPATVEVAFITPSTDITILGSGTGAGTVTGTDGLRCEITAGQTSGICHTEKFGMLQSDVELSATPREGSTFSGWIGCPVLSFQGRCIVRGFTKAVVTATFTALPPPQEP